MKTMNSLMFWCNYFSMILNGIALCLASSMQQTHWLNYCNFTAMIISYCLVMFTIHNVTYMEKCFSHLINYIATFAVVLYIVNTESNKWVKMIGCIGIVYLFFAICNRIAMIIEKTDWYFRMERGRLSELDKEEQGSEPDPKDFETVEEKACPTGWDKV